MRTIPPAVNDLSTADCPILPRCFCLLSARSCRVFYFLLFLCFFFFFFFILFDFILFCFGRANEQSGAHAAGSIKMRQKKETQRHCGGGGGGGGGLSQKSVDTGIGESSERRGHVYIYILRRAVCLVWRALSQLSPMNMNIYLYFSGSLVRILRNYSGH